MKTFVDRILFDATGKAIKWERSYDGRAWEEVEWLGGELPFILLKPIEVIDCVIHCKVDA